MGDIADNLARVRARIAEAAERAGRAADSVQLMAVSKKKPAEAIREAYAAGQRDFGENYAQELSAKAEALDDLDDLRLHMIGHLQRNKARHVVRVAASIHTIDSIRLAREVARRAAPASGSAASPPPFPVLIEVNVGGEAEKSGCEPAALGEIVAECESLTALRLDGLMTVPPLSDDPGDTRRHFETLARLRDGHGGAERLPELSMGMTRDLEHAIAAGATIVRVGTAIFGARAP